VLSDVPVKADGMSGVTSTVCEPSVAARGKEVLVTGRWFAAWSQDGGKTYRYVNPQEAFPAPGGGAASVIEQHALYDRKRDLMLWVIAYSPSPKGNTVRLAYAAKSDIAGFRWRYLDLTPEGVGRWSGEWFDYTDVALGASYLYLTANLFRADGALFTRSVAVRVPLEQLARYERLTFNFFSPPGVFGLRGTHGAGDTMYFGGHLNDARLRVFAWPEVSKADPTYQDVRVDPSRGLNPEAPGPDGRDWLGRCDGRVTAAWAAGDTIGFAWTVGQDKVYPRPHIRVAVLDKTTRRLLSQPHLWSKTHAFAYPAAAPNSAAQVAFAFYYGGGPAYPSYALGVLGPPSKGSPGRWDVFAPPRGRGKSGPARNGWGDFMTIRAHGARPETWVVAAYTLQTGPNDSDVEVRYVHFRLKPAGKGDD
jgi:hypothetical protein